MKGAIGVMRIFSSVEVSGRGESSCPSGTAKSVETSNEGCAPELRYLNLSSINIYNTSVKIYGQVDWRDNGFYTGQSIPKPFKP